MKAWSMKRRMQAVTLAVVLTLVCSIPVLGAEFVSVVKDGVNLRSGPDTSKTILFQLPAHYPLMVLEHKGEWLKVKDFEGDKGWIYSSLVTKKKYVIVTVNEGNVRQGPGTNYDKVGTVTREVVLKQLERKGDWVKVSHPRLTGWLHKKLIWP